MKILYGFWLLFDIDIFTSTAYLQHHYTLRPKYVSRRMSELMIYKKIAILPPPVYPYQNKIWAKLDEKVANLDFYYYFAYFLSLNSLKHYIWVFMVSLYSNVLSGTLTPNFNQIGWKITKFNLYLSSVNYCNTNKIGNQSARKCILSRGLLLGQITCSNYKKA